MTEQEMRSRMAHSREDGCRAVFEEYASYVYAIVWQKLSGVGTREDAEECVSDVFANVFRQFDRIYEGSLRAYVGTAARRTAINAYYRLSAHSTLSLDEEDHTDIPDAADIPADYEKAAQARELLSRIRALGEPDSTIVIARFYYGKSSPEIGRMTGMSAPAVRMRLKRILKKLKKELEKEDLT